MKKLSNRAGCAAILPISALCVAFPACAQAQIVAEGSQTSAVAENPSATAPVSQSVLPSLKDGKRIFLPAYFTNDRPQTAADMVGRVPGFSIENGDNVRGFGGAAGNVLIDGARPTSKSDELESILARIPAANVERIELLEGAAAGALAPGKNLVVNIVRKADSKSGGNWDVVTEINSNGRVKPRGETSYTARFGNLNVTLGLNAGIFGAETLAGFEFFSDALGNVTEQGPNDDRRRRRGGGGNVSIDGKFGAYKLSANASVGANAFRRRFNHIAFLTGAGTPYRVDEGEESADENRWELGADIERDILGWTGKIALLAKREDEERFSIAGFNELGDPKSFGRFASEATAIEQVARMTFKRKLGDHQLELGGEYAFNSLDFSGAFSESTGGVFIVQPSDISSTEVSENRQEAFVSDSWTLTPKLTLESTLTGEWSTISQTGDAAKERSFFYLKPRMQVDYKPATGWTYRAAIERDVSQLDFGAFADSSSVGEGNQNSGNPELRPEQSWGGYVELERRWGKRGVFTASLRRREFEDKLTLVPTGNGGIALGNILEASAWGYNLSWTLPLDFLLKGLETDGSYQWRKTQLIDPITERTRPFSGNNGNSFNAGVRYDIPEKKLRFGAWIFRGDNNRDFRDDQEFKWATVQFWGLWVETKAIAGLTFELGVENPFGNRFSRDRFDFSPDRRTGSIIRTQYRERIGDASWYLQAKGAF